MFEKSVTLTMRPLFSVLFVLQVGGDFSPGSLSLSGGSSGDLKLCSERKHVSWQQEQIRHNFPKLTQIKYGINMFIYLPIFLLDLMLSHVAFLLQRTRGAHVLKVTDRSGAGLYLA